MGVALVAGAERLESEEEEEAGQHQPEKEQPELAQEPQRQVIAELLLSFSFYHFVFHWVPCLVASSSHSGSCNSSLLCA